MRFSCTTTLKQILHTRLKTHMYAVQSFTCINYDLIYEQTGYVDHFGLERMWSIIRSALYFQTFRQTERKHVQTVFQVNVPNLSIVYVCMCFS